VTSTRSNAGQLGRVLGRVAPALVAVVLALAMTWPLALHLGDRIGQDLGDPLFQTWQVAWIGHALSHQPLHLFQANILWPNSDSLAFSDALIGYAPVGLLAQSGPHSALVAYNLLFLFAYALAFLGAYLLARELGAGIVGSYVAGAAFAYAPWRLSHNGHLNVLSSGGVPLALFLLVRGYRRRSPAMIVAGWAVTAWQVTLGFSLSIQLAYLLGALGLIGAVAWLRRGRPRLDRRLAVATTAGVALVALVAMLQARPYFRVVDAHPEAKRTPALVAVYSPPLKGFLAAPEQSLVWGGVTKRFRSPLSWPPEQTLFPGLLVVLLAVTGLVSSAYPRRLRIGLAAGAVTCAVFSVGLRDVSGMKKWVMPYRWIYEFAPGWDAIRTPGRIMTLTSLALALLAGAGASLVVAAVRRHGAAWRQPYRRGLVVAMGALLTGLILLEGLGPLDLHRVPPPPPGQRGAFAPQLHLPTSIGFDPAHAYWSTAGFPAIVNGIGAFEPTDLERLREATASFPDDKSVAALRALGVRTVVLHPSLVVGTRWQDAASRPIDGLPLRRTVTGGVILYELPPSQPESTG
jgi:hypothetical protein